MDKESSNMKMEWNVPCNKKLKEKKNERCKNKIKSTKEGREKWKEVWLEEFNNPNVET